MVDHGGQLAQPIPRRPDPSLPEQGATQPPGHDPRWPALGSWINARSASAIWPGQIASLDLRGVAEVAE